VARFEDHGVDGKQLLSIAPEKFAELHVDEKEKEKINHYITHLIDTSVPAPCTTSCLLYLFIYYY
jgi:hypothetical protein